MLYDAYTNFAKSLLRVPAVMIIHPAILALCMLCGVIACVAYALTDPKGGDVVSTALTLKAQNPLLRGFVVGATVLVLLRSRLFNTQDSGFGGEAIYTLLRSLAIQSVNDYATRQRDRFLDLNIDAAFALGVIYFLRLQGTIERSIASRAPEYQSRVRDQIAAVTSTAPKTQMNHNDPDWESFYRAYTGICFDYCGPKILSTYPGFRTGQGLG